MLGTALDFAPTVKNLESGEQYSSSALWKFAEGTKSPDESSN